MLKKSISHIPSIALMVVGTGLAFWGYQKSSGLESKITNVLTGSHTDNVMMLYIAAAVCFVLGIFFYLKKN